jgi:hypothetical protein
MSFTTTGMRSLVADYSPDASSAYRGATSSSLQQDVINATTPGPVGSINTITSAPNGIGQITFTFTPPTNTGGAPIIDYTAICTNTVTNQIVSTTQNALSLTLTPVVLAQPYNCSIFATNSAGSGTAVAGSATAFASLNIDGSTATVYDAATDGVMILRYMTGIRGDAISDGVIGATATRNAAQIATYLDNIKRQFDIDGDGAVNPATDGALIVRHMRGMSLSSSYIMNVFNPTGLRGNEDDITSYLARMMP